MKTNILILSAALCLSLTNVFAQDRDENVEIQTLFRGNSLRSSGGYGAITNKFTKINGQNANLVGLYGGWNINQRFMIGLGGSATTNNLPVPAEFSVLPGEDLSYEYGQFGLVTEYMIGSNKTFHLVFNLMAGAGFTVQYDRNSNEEPSNNFTNTPTDENWFFVAEPGVQLEVNLFRWMRFSPGYSYRSVYGSDAPGLRDKALSGSSLNLTLKFGKF